MKQSLFTAILLSLLSLLLIIGAALFFLLQDRQQMTAAHLELSVVSTITAADAQQASNSHLATRTAQETAAQQLQQSLMQRQEALTALQSEYETMSAELATLAMGVANAKHAPPEVRIVEPTADNNVQLGQSVDLLFLAAHASGLTTMHITLNDEPLFSYTIADELAFTAHERWTPQEIGTYTFALMAVNIYGQSSEIATRTLIVEDFVAMNNALRQQIEENVIEIRGLQPKTAVIPTLMTQDELRMLLEEDLLVEDSAAQTREDILVLNAFDFVPLEFGLTDYLVDLHAEQVSGFYDPETDEFVVISEDGLLDVANQFTHAHEFVHALQDQYFSLDSLSSIALNGDARMAFRALAEGDATLVQIRYLREGYFSASEQRELFELFDDLESPTMDDGPTALTNSFSFPYEYGGEFAQYLYDLNGFAALNDAWGNPPRSTEHILHPERYVANDTPRFVTLPQLESTLGDGWKLLDEDTLGEFFLREYLTQQLSSSEVDTAATGWGGDRYAVYWHEETESRVLILKLLWDTLPDADQFMTAYTEYGNRWGTAITAENRICWEDGDHYCLFQQEDMILIVHAPDREMINLLQSSLLPPN